MTNTYCAVYSKLTPIHEFSASEARPSGSAFSRARRAPLRIRGILVIAQLADARTITRDQGVNLMTK